MKVIVAETAGFCQGVRTALEMTLEAARSRQKEPLCTFGPLIHNRQVLAMLKERGVEEAAIEEACRNRWVIVRAHGIPPDQRRRLKEISLGLIDATCKRVARVQAIIRRYARKGYHTLIVGDADHAEVIGLMGYTEGRGMVIQSPDDLDRVPANWPLVLLVAQTTQNQDVFQAVEARFRKRFPQGVVHNTICGATHERQNEVRRLCERVQAMVIVGGTHSGNTQRLAETARECGVPTYHVETEKDLDCQEMCQFHTVGVSAGASTPNWMIRNVVRFLENLEPNPHALQAAVWRRRLEKLAYTNAASAAAAGLLTAAVSAVTNLPIGFVHILMAASYAFAMHTLNRYIDREALQLNDPQRAAYYASKRAAFTATGVTAAVVALGSATADGMLTALLMVLILAVGSLYAVPLFQSHWIERTKIIMIKDIPGSKTLTIPLAWASVTVWLPHLQHIQDGLGKLLYAFMLVFLLVLARTALLDCLDIQGDRLVGRETVVVLWGEQRAGRFIVGVLVLIAVAALTGPLWRLSSPFSVFFAAAAAAYGVFFRYFRGRRIKDAAYLETLIESVLVGVGLLGCLWIWLGSL
ncbi:4-hydroxy-3-methylbut-2-enyl diphosphate reductase [Desulfosoma caldarium]|uniref:4-hydroxy-3-methylbut-2-enyl diphosphate reductase n=1 Tax=Desulfosoma caldarium TaxID=610254 RepID=A0A3N1VMN9_9BACT|nr:4-hydroxy-3-methylbut-2-enyl diphosphate reductase [Desulfosoma caldarium]ROR03220.1 4-hydroxy-3-methylbut-2-enyl diphosphate reductase [Desulfosoma caldarium]